MTCAHVLDLIDTDSLADYPRAHLDAAWQHARQCGTCGPALAAATALTVDLRALSQRTRGQDLTAAVLARIAQIEEAIPAAPGATALRQANARSSARRSSWATALVGVGAGLAIVFSTPLGDGSAIGLALPRLRGLTAGLVAMPSTTTGTLILAAGLVLYVAGLFAPLANRSRQ